MSSPPKITSNIGKKSHSGSVRNKTDKSEGQPESVLNLPHGIRTLPYLNANFHEQAIFWFLVLYKLNSCFKIITLLSRDKKNF